MKYSILTSLCLCASILSQANVLASDEPAEQSSRLRVKNFGVTERFTTQSAGGLNLSTLLSWNPYYQLAPWLNIEGQIGGTGMTSTLGTFIAARYQLGVSFHELLPSLFNNEDRLVPEFLLGAETWMVSAGGTYFAASLNLHYRFHFQEGIFKIIDSVHAGYQYIPGTPISAQQYTVGLRIVPFPEKRISDTPKVEAAPAPVSLEQAPPKKTIEGLIGKLEGIQFLNGKATIKPVSFPTIDKVFAAMQTHENLKVEIVGHTDNTGPEDTNVKLSQHRADAVSHFLVKKGISPSRLTSKGYGPKQPINNNSTEEGRAANRRVEFVITQE